MEPLFVAKKDKDPAVFECPLVEFCNIDDWELLDDLLFVDSGGFRTDNELALTAAQFLEKIKKGFGYAVVEQGLFQLHVGVYQKKKG